MDGLIARVRNTIAHSKRGEWIVWGPLGSLVVAGFAVAWWFIEPAPPDRLRIAAGSPGGAYHSFAEAYRRRLADHGLELEVLATAGSVENLKLLRSGEASLAFIQGGTAQEAEGVEALASLYFEPLWVFYRAALGAPPIDRFGDFRGKRLALGPPDSGTRLLSLELLKDNGLHSVNTELLPLGGEAAAEALIEGKVDAAFFVTSPQATYVRRLIETQEVRLMSFRRSRAYRNRYRFLSAVTLGEGMIDLHANIPPGDRVLLAPTALLVARRDLYQDLVPLLLEVVIEVHRDGGLFENPGQFPNLSYTELPVNSNARRYLENGPSLLQRVLPFWIASLADRTKILLLPLVTLLIPLLRMAPPIYRWRIRSKIYRWYAVLREIDQGMDQSQGVLELQREIHRLRTVQEEIATVSVPLAYMEEFYNLRMHLGLILDKLEHRKEAQAETS